MERLPWVSISPLAALRDLTTDEGGYACLTVRQRSDVAGRRWWALAWMGPDGAEHSAEAGDLQLCLRRAAEIERDLREQEWGEEG